MQVGVPGLDAEHLLQEVPLGQPSRGPEVHGRPGERHEVQREHPRDAGGDVGPDLPRRAQRVEVVQREHEARQDEEDIDADEPGARSRDREVAREDQQDRDSAEALEFGPESGPRWWMCQHAPKFPRDRNSTMIRCCLPDAGGETYRPAVLLHIARTYGRPWAGRGGAAAR